jgi:hypothetical protein
MTGEEREKESSMDTLMRVWILGALVLGAVLVAIAVTYWVLPAEELPTWLPGHTLSSHPAHGHHHKRHGLVSFILGVTYLSGAYLVSRDRRAAT